MVTSGQTEIQMWIDRLEGTLWSSYVLTRSMRKTHTAPFSEGLDHLAQEKTGGYLTNIENEAGGCANGDASHSIASKSVEEIGWILPSTILDSYHMKGGHGPASTMW